MRLNESSMADDDFPRYAQFPVAREPPLSVLDIVLRLAAFSLVEKNSFDQISKLPIHSTLPLIVFLIT